jgi:hypothetical protein
MPTVVPSIAFPTPDASLSSGTVGETVIDTVMVVEHAVRRCNKNPATLTPEQLDTARNNLHFILSALSNRGANLWAVEEVMIPLVENQRVYTTPIGTESIKNIVHRRVSRMDVSALLLSGLSYCLASLSAPANINLVGFKLADTLSTRLVLEYTADGVQWQTAINYNDITLAQGWHWVTFDPAIAAISVRLRDSTDNPLALVDMVLAADYADTTMFPFNSDEYTAIPNKTEPGRPLNYFFDKQLEAKLKLWPVPTDELGMVVAWRQRRIQDVGELSDKLEIPDRWFESVIWSLAKNMAFELPEVASDRIQLCVQQAAAALQDAELGESDGAPMYIRPNISGYTR